MEPISYEANANQNPTTSEAIKISFVTETYPPEINGVAKTLHKMLTGLREREYKIQLIRPRQHKRELREISPGFQEVLLSGMKIPMYKDLRFGFPSVRKLVRIWKVEKPDLVHIVTAGPLGWAAEKAARRLNIPVISDFRTNFDAYCKYFRVGFATKIVERYLRGLHNRTFRTLVPSSDLTAKLRAAGYKNVEKLGRGIDVHLFHPSKRSENFRVRFGIDSKDTLLLYVGRVSPEKNLNLLLSTYRRIQRESSNVRLVVVGDGPIRKDIQKSFPDIVFTGMLKGEELAEAYASSDLFLFPSLTETFGNVVMEAMASGLPVVAFDYAAAKEYLRHSDSVSLAEYNNSEDFIETSLRLFANQELRQSLSQKNRKIALSCSWSTIIENLEIVYRSALTERPEFRTRMVPKLALGS